MARSESILLVSSIIGRVAEWPIAAALKAAVGQPTVGSNPTSSVDNIQQGAREEWQSGRLQLFRKQSSGNRP